MLSSIDRRTANTSQRARRFYLILVAPGVRNASYFAGKRPHPADKVSDKVGQFRALRFLKPVLAGVLTLSFAF
jgi:hypothetical protein